MTKNWFMPVVLLALALLALPGCGYTIVSVDALKSPSGVSAESVAQSPTIAARPAVQPKRQTVRGHTVAPSGTASVTSTNPLAVVEFTDGTVCPVTTVSGRENIWKTAGSSAYAGASGYAISGFSVPAEVKRGWTAAVEKGDLSPRTIKPGARFCAMWYSTKSSTTDRTYHHLWKNVVVGDWPESDNQPTGADVYTVEHQGYLYHLVKPEVCDNWSFFMTRVSEKTGAVLPPPSPASSNMVVAGNDSFFLRIRPFLDESLPSDLRKEIRRITALESDNTAAFARGAVSRDLGALMTKLVLEGTASTINHCFEARVDLPGDLRTRNIRSCPGDNARFPELTYWELFVPRDVAAEQNSQFGALIHAPEGCSVVSPAFNSEGGKRHAHYIDTRLGTRGGDLSELARAARNGTPGFNLNAVINCDQSEPN